MNTEDKKYHYEDFVDRLAEVEHEEVFTSDNINTNAFTDEEWQAQLEEMMKVNPTTDEILTKRQAQHGDFRVNSVIAQGLKTQVRIHSNWDKLSTIDKEAIDNILQKIARHISGGGNHRDTVDDIVGYATLMQKKGEL